MGQKTKLKLFVSLVRSLTFCIDSQFVCVWFYSFSHFFKFLSLSLNFDSLSHELCAMFKWFLWCCHRMQSHFWPAAYSTHWTRQTRWNLFCIGRQLSMKICGKTTFSVEESEWVWEKETHFGRLYSIRLHNFGIAFSSESSYANHHWLNLFAAVCLVSFSFFFTAYACVDNFPKHEMCIILKRSKFILTADGYCVILIFQFCN